MKLRRTRALIVCPSISPGGGPPGYTYNLRSGYESVGPSQDVEFVFFGAEGETRSRAGESQPKLDGGAQRQRSHLRMAAHRLRIGLLLFRLRNGARLIVNTIRADVAVFQGYQNPAPLIFAHLMRREVVYMPHAPTPRAAEEEMLCEARGYLAEPRRIRQMWRRERTLFRTAKHIVFPSLNSMKAYEVAFRDELNGSRVHFIESGVDVELPGVKKTAGGSSNPRVIFAGRYVSHKGYDLFVSAAEELRSRGCSAEFLTIGAGPSKKDSFAVEDLGWTESPHEIIANSSIVVIPNRVAYYDLLPLEVAALGKPLVMTNVGGNFDQLEALPDTIGTSIENLSSAIADAIDRIGLDPDWGVRNRAIYRSRFTTTALANRWLVYITRVHRRTK